MDFDFLKRLGRSSPKFKNLCSAGYYSGVSCAWWLNALIKHKMLPQYKGISVKNEFTQDS